MTQIYIIRMVQHPETKSICMNQEQYNDFLHVTENCDMSCYPQECFSIVTVEALNDVFIYKEQTISCEDAVKITSLAMHIRVTDLKDSIMQIIKNDAQAEK